LHFKWNLKWRRKRGADESEPDNPSSIFESLNDVIAGLNHQPTLPARGARLSSTLLRQAARVLAASLLVSLFVVCAAAQQPPPIKRGATTPPDLPTTRDADDPDQGSHTEEMVKDAEIKRDEALYKENVGRAKETAQLASEVRDAFHQQKTLGAVELKKLGRIEKLARSIRNELGGGDGDEGLKDPPVHLDEALDRLTDISADLCKRIEKTPRHVVSAAAIATANQLIELTKHIRTIGG
jgi:hypothetical protein